MTTGDAVDMIREALSLMLLLSTPILVTGLCIGLIISVLQPVTQVQEQTLTFVPKIVGMAVVAIVLAPWAVQHMVEFSVRVFGGQ